LVLEYYVVLRSLLKAKPHLRPYRKRCRHCRIFFLTHPRNRGRKDLGCPFGCRDAHRRKHSTERSRAYNRSPAGKLKKKLRNRKRKVQLNPAPDEQPGQETARAELQGSEFDPGVVQYVRVVVSLIEGRRVSRDEILEMLRRAMRQRSFARERRIDYVVRTLKEKPP
ncbi:MAG: hypothetical protein ACRD1Z_05905, partial [Vicinamibacteria bacterium]